MKKCTGHTGCMFAGKTTSLLKDAEAYEKDGKEVLYLKYSMDTRYGDGITTHTGVNKDATPVASLCGEHVSQYSDCDVLCIDEAQFIKGVAEFCRRFIEEYPDKYVIWAGLDLDYNVEKFQEVEDLKAFSEYTVHTAICHQCNGVAKFSYPKKHLSGGNEHIGGSELWQALCENCRFYSTSETLPDDDPLDYSSYINTLPKNVATFTKDTKVANK
jgi:thymidine kinase